MLRKFFEVTNHLSHDPIGLLSLLEFYRHQCSLSVGASLTAQQVNPASTWQQNSLAWSSRDREEDRNGRFLRARYSFKSCSLSKKSSSGAKDRRDNLIHRRVLALATTSGRFVCIPAAANSTSIDFNRVARTS